VRNRGSARVFEGGFGKCGVLWWCFCGEFVVDCVVNVVRWMVIFPALKTCQLFKIIFLSYRSLPNCRLPQTAVGIFDA
jgi:hypothetical protein